MSQTGDIDIIISIHVLRFGSRLEVEAHVFTAGLQRRGMEPESFRYLRSGRGRRRSEAWERYLPLTLSVRRPGAPRARAVDVLGARRLRGAGPLRRGPLGRLQGAHPHGRSADPPGEGFSPLDDPFHQQPQQCRQDEGQGGGDQDVKSLAFQPRQGVLVEGSEEERRGRGKEEVWEGGRFKAAFPNSQLFGKWLFGKWPLSLKKPSPHPTLKEPCLLES